MSAQTPERAPGVLLTVGWVIVAVLVSPVIPYAGVVVAVIGALVLRARWKPFLVLAVLLLAFTLTYFPIAGSGVGSSGLTG